jgi:hypothetical protein
MRHRFLRLGRIGWLLGLLAVAALASASTAAAAPSRAFEYELSGCDGAAFAQPSSVAVDDYGNFYALDAANGTLQIFNPQGACMKTISGLRLPRDVAVDSNGVVYVVVASPPPNGSPGQLLRLSPSQFPPTPSTTYSTPAVILEGAVGENLLGVAVNHANDHVYATRVKRVWELGSLAENNQFLDSIGDGDLTANEGGVAINETTGDIYISDRFNGLINRYDGDTHALVDQNDGSNRPQGKFTLGSVESLEVDQSTGDVLAWDGSKGIVDEFDEADHFVTQIGPAFGMAEMSLDGSPGPQISVDNGDHSPKRGFVYVPSYLVAPARIFVFGPLLAPKPSVQNQPASPVGSETAVLRGRVNPNGLKTTSCQFEYVAEQAFEGSGFAGADTVACAQSASKIGSGTEFVDVFASLAGLAPGTYVFRLAVSNENGTAFADPPLRFGPPDATTLPASPVFTTEATLRGEVDPNGMPTEYRFEYGLTEAYGSQTTPVTVSGSSPQAVEATVTGLQPGQTYHFRLSASSEVSSATGADRAFATIPAEIDEQCPNADRRMGLSALLPDCRSYELVTPAYVAGLPLGWFSGEANSGSFPTSPASRETDSVLFATEGSVSGDVGNGGRDTYVALRGPGGWAQELFSPTEAAGIGAANGGVSSDQHYSFWTFKSTEGGLAEALHYLRTPVGFEPIGIGSGGVDYLAIGRLITANASHIIFTSKAALEPGAGPAGEEAIYDRSPGQPTKVLSLLPDGEAAEKEVSYLGASADGSTVAFFAGEPVSQHLYVRKAGSTYDVLTYDDGNGSDETANFAGLSSDGRYLFYVKNNDLSRFDTATQSSTLIASGSGAKFVNVSADGSRAYFSSTAVLTGGEENPLGAVAQPGEDNLYVWKGGTDEVRFVAVLDPQDLQGFFGYPWLSLGSWVESLSPVANGIGSGPGQDPSRSTPDGRVLVFQSHGDLTGQASAGHSQVFRYDTGGSLVCVSCNPTRVAPKSEAMLEYSRDLNGAHISGFGNKPSPLDSLTLLRNVTDDGSMVFFVSGEQLVPRDVNQAEDVYEWHDGRLSLISSGQGEHDSFLYSVTPDGHDVYFTTEDALVPADQVEHSFSLYDARVGGGFAEEATPGPCAGDACQGGVQSPLGFPSPASEGTASERGATQPRSRCHRPRQQVRRHGKVRCVKKHRKHTTKRSGK